MRRIDDGSIRAKPVTNQKIHILANMISREQNLVVVRKIDREGGNRNDSGSLFHIGITLTKNMLI